jgi:hypothetical protein
MVAVFPLMKKQGKSNIINFILEIAFTPGTGNSRRAAWARNR